MGGDLDQLDLVAERRAAASATQPAWAGREGAAAGAEPDTPVDAPAGRWRRVSRAATVGAGAHAIGPVSGRHGHRGDVVRVEVEQVAQRLRRSRRRSAVAGQLLHPDGGRVQQLLDHPVHGQLHLGAGLLVQGGQPLLQPGQLGGDHLGGPRAQRDHGRGDGLRAAPRSGRPRPPRPRGPAPPSGAASELARGGQVASAEHLEVEDLRRRAAAATAGSTSRGRREVDVDLRRRSAADALTAAATAVGVDHVADRAGAGDDQVGLGQRLVERRRTAAPGRRWPRPAARPGRGCG